MTVGNILMTICNMHVVELLFVLISMAIMMGLLLLVVSVLEWIFKKYLKDKQQ